MIFFKRAIYLLFICNLFSAVITAQDNYKVNLISTRYVKSIQGGMGEKWEIRDSKNYKGIVIKTKITGWNYIDTLNTSHIVLECKLKDELISIPCSGITFAEAENEEFWVFNELSKNNFFQLSNVKKEKAIKISFLFVLPVGAKINGMKYFDEVIIKKISIK